MKRTRLKVVTSLIGIIMILLGGLFGIIENQEGSTLKERFDAAYHAYMPLSGTKPLYIRQLVGPDMGTKRTILWETTEFEPNSVVVYKLKGEDNSTIKVVPATADVIKEDKTVRRYVYSVEIADLEPNQEYVFQVGKKDHTDGVWHQFSTKKIDTMTAVDLQSPSSWVVPQSGGSVQIVGVKKYNNHFCLHGSGHECPDMHPNTLICYDL